MRNKVASEITKNFNKYYEGIVSDMIEHDKFNIDNRDKNDIKECVNSYIASIKINKWAGAIEIEVAELIWERAIFVLDNDGNKRRRFNCNDIDNNSPLYKNKPVFLIYKGENNYNALVKVSYS